VSIDQGLSPRDSEIWKSARDAAARTTGIVTILLAGLLASFMGLMAGLARYPAAIATAGAVARESERTNLASATTQQAIQRDAEGKLIHRLAGIEAKRDQPTACEQTRSMFVREFIHEQNPSPPNSSQPRAELIREPDHPIDECAWEMPPLPVGGTSTAELDRWATSEKQLDIERAKVLAEFLKRKDPQFRNYKPALSDTEPTAKVSNLNLTDVSDFPNNPWLVELIATAVDSVSGRYAQISQAATHAYARKRVLAEATTFRLLGLDFSVGGYWAWPVWLAFFTAGMVQLWLSRRRLIRQCRAADSNLAYRSAVAPYAAGGSEGLPLWARPLRVREPWTPAFVRPIAADIASEPLSAVTVVLFLLALGAGLFVVVPISFLSNALLHPEGFTVERVAHLALICVLAAAIVGLAATWPDFPEPSTDSRRVQVIGRRALLIAGVSAAAAAALALLELRGRAVARFLMSPRYRQVRSFVSVPQRRIRRIRREVPCQKPGFYTDSRQTIHFISESGRARSLMGRRSVASHLTPWAGPFDQATIDRVHPRARWPFVITGVRQLLSAERSATGQVIRHGITHRPARFRNSQAQQELIEQGRALVLRSTLQHVGDAEKGELNRQPQNKLKYRQAFDLAESAVRLTNQASSPENFVALLEAIAINSQDPVLRERAKTQRSRYEERRLQRRASERQLRATQLMTAMLRRAGSDAARPPHSRHAGRKHRGREKALKYLIKRYPDPVGPILTDAERSLMRAAVGRQLDRADRTSMSRATPGSADVKDQLQKILQKAAAGQDYSLELALLPDERDEPRSGKIGDDGRSANNSEANLVHVARRNKRRPKARPKSCKLA